MVALAVGVIAVTEGGLGARCCDLERQLLPLLTPPPDAVFYESYAVNPKRLKDIEINFALRAAIASEMSRRGIPCEQVSSQQWKVAVAGTGNGNAEKSVAKAALEASLGTEFPSKMPSPTGGKDVMFKADASDATGIGVWGARQMHPTLSFALRGPISMPKLTQASGGKKRARDER